MKPHSSIMHGRGLRLTYSPKPVLNRGIHCPLGDVLEVHGGVCWCYDILGFGVGMREGFLIFSV